MSAHRVLVVDDDEDIRESLMEFLEDHGYESVGASHGREALAKIQSGDHTWEAMVPTEVGEMIKRRRFLGYRPEDHHERI